MEGNSFERYIEIYNSYFIAEKLKEEKIIKKEYPECPVFDTGCPYCLASGECTLTHPEDECDDYYYYNGEEEEEDEANIFVVTL